MERYLTWNKGIFESNYQIFESGKIKCTLFFDTWRSEAKAISQSKNYRFKDDGLYGTTTQIFDGNNELIGFISYSDWKSKATITLNSGEKYAFEFTNTWHSQWRITNFNDKQINYDSSTSSGTVVSNNDDELMLLIGFYAREHFTKMIMLIIFIIIFLPMISRGIF
ncbi:hypothetical protein EZ428_09185 [Pedobacter frigiditerrae]|uniref:Uncharacterized protein n=1 Tax=Pedobacter frigiditerrae TaxID=2530452 RepID=A0A4R0MXA6_9SPHI|nr:hypothetical protein [Pedobacter frigiditerrae]TCC91911.1 hypothetical protein EZ428_09185 [Pedobacter frigiditerrae]